MIEMGALDFLPAAQNRAGFEAEAMALLSERAARFTMGDSSSMRVETARELLSGILYCIRLHFQDSDAANEPARPVSELFLSGLSDVKSLVRRGRLLLSQAERSRPPAENLGFTDTLFAIASFFKRYDPDFFAHQIPCDIDYPLCHPVSEETMGVEYINTYLRRLLAESGFLCRFSAQRLTTLYEACFGDYRELLVNLYTPVAEAAIGCALCGQDAKDLYIPPAERTRLIERLRKLPEEQMEKEIAVAAEQALDALAVTGAGEREYLVRAGMEMIPRIRSAADFVHANGLFPSIPFCG